MKILFLSKRHYMGKDLVLNRYGRFYSIPKAMARMGNDIHLHTLSYRRMFGATGQQQRSAEGANLLLRDHGVASLVSQAYLLGLLGDCRRFQPDIVIGASDIPHLIFARILARAMSIPFVADLYDQFLAYGQTRAPFAGRLYRSTLLSADCVTCVSNSLAEWVRGLGVTIERTVVVGNAVEEHFTNLERGGAKRWHREAFGLPADGILIGTAGALTRDRDICTLYRAQEILSQRDKRVYLVVAGPRRADLPVPRGVRIIDLGELRHEQVPAFLSALDVGVVCNLDSLFARNCFPQKYLEMRAVNLPVVAAGVGDLLGYGVSDNTWHYSPGDPASLVAAVMAALAGFDSVRTTVIPTWSLQAARMLRGAKNAVERRRGGGC